MILYPDGTRKITYEGKTIKERFEDEPNSKRSNKISDDIYSLIIILACILTTMILFGIGFGLLK